MKPRVSIPLAAVILIAALGSVSSAQTDAGIGAAPAEAATAILSTHRPPSPPAPIDPRSQLLITDLRVIEDPLRTDPRNGSRATWSFRYLMENMAGAMDPALFTERWLENWERDQVINGQLAPARMRIRELVIEPWLSASGGRRLDLDRAPFKLLAIVNRIDLREHTGSLVENAGEGRFVFGLLDPGGRPLPPVAGPGTTGFTVIFEYELPARSMADLRSWAQAWAGLGSRPLGSDAYKRDLEVITRRFTDRGSAPAKPNGSALNQIRSNEIALAAPWELREFRIDAGTGQLFQDPVAGTPDTVALNGKPAFAALINSNERALLDQSFELDPGLAGPASLAGPFAPSDFPDFFARSFVRIPLGPVFDIPWSAAGVRSNDARHAFALNTCNGCHRAETATPFVQIGFPVGHRLPASLGTPAALARFLTGETIPDPVVPGRLRSFNDLERRRLDLELLLGSFVSGLGPIDEARSRAFVH